MEKNRIANWLNHNEIVFDENKSFKTLTSLKTGGNASVAVYPKDEKQAVVIRRYAENEKIPLLILGRGTNVLAPDEDFFGIVMVFNDNFSDVTLENDEIIVKSGAALSAVCKIAKENQLAGLEFAYGIPGTVGGAVMMNAGAYGGEMCDVIKSVTIADENDVIVNIPLEKCDFAYRSSCFQKRDCLILSAVLKLCKGNEKEISDKMEEILAKRKDKQPLNFPSAGSTFKRPEGYFAAALIDECGLKGTCIGGACVSEKHAGFVVNKGEATSKDVKDLCEKIKKTVYEQKGVELETEIKVL